MSRYAYIYRDSSATNAVRSCADDWSKPSNSSDHVCRPVLIDAEGKKRPIISHTPNQNTQYFVTETVVERVHSPVAVAAQYKYSSAAKIEPTKTYGNVEDKWNRPTSPVNDRPQKVDEFITKVQTEASRPNTNRFPLGATYWHQRPNTYQATPNYGDRSEVNNQEWNKPNDNAIRNENYDEHNRKNDSAMKPTMITTGGWARPSHATWPSPPEGSLSRPTSDINKAMEYLKEAAKPSPGITTNPGTRLMSPTSAGPKRDAYPETIDSKEAARRYGNHNFSPRENDNDTATIDSREAAKKYGGRIF